MSETPNKSVKPKYWLGQQQCQLCMTKYPVHLIDGKTIKGPWAVMCGDCHDIYGLGLGQGLGQKYRRTVTGDSMASTYVYIKVGE